MNVKPVSYKEVKQRLLQDEETNTLYLLEKRVDELQDLLKEMRQRAGLTVSQVAQRMGVTQPAISRLEKNASRASFLTLQRYAKACGRELQVGAI